jgi:hypothetical protein
MKKNYSSVAITAFIFSLASLMLPPGGDLNAADIFSKVTGIIGSGADNSRGAAWGDYDDDGFIDLFVANTGPDGSGPARHFLYHNNTDGTFSRVTNGPVATVASDARGCVWGDYDNDGYLDLVIGIDGEGNLPLVERAVEVAGPLKALGCLVVRGCDTLARRRHRGRG